MSRIQPAQAILRNLHIAQKAIADGRHGCDVTRLPDLITEQAPQNRNIARERILRNCGVVPHGIQKFFFRDQPVGITEQKEQNPKGLRLDRQYLATFDNAELPFAHLYIVEAENTVLVFLHERFTPFKE